MKILDILFQVYHSLNSFELMATGVYFLFLFSWLLLFIYISAEKTNSGIKSLVISIINVLIMRIWVELIKFIQLSNKMLKPQFSNSNELINIKQKGEQKKRRSLLAKSQLTNRSLEDCPINIHSESSKINSYYTSSIICILELFVCKKWLSSFWVFYAFNLFLICAPVSQIKLIYSLFVSLL